MLSRCLSHFRAIRSLQHSILRLRDFMRFGGKTPYRLVNRGPYPPNKKTNTSDGILMYWMDAYSFPRNYTQSSCFVAIRCRPILPIAFRVTSLALGIWLYEYLDWETHIIIVLQIVIIHYNECWWPCTVKIIFANSYPDSIAKKTKKQGIYDICSR